MLKGLYNIFWIVVLQFTVSMILPCFIPLIQMHNYPTSGWQMEDFPKLLLLAPYVYATGVKNSTWHHFCLPTASDICWTVSKQT